MVLNNNLFNLRRLLQNTRQFYSSKSINGYEPSGKTTVNIINITEEKLLINKCLPVGFKLSDDSLVMGPLAIISQTIFSWNVGSAKDIDEATLSLFTTLHPPLDLLILGLETDYDYKKVLEIRKLLLKHNIKIEILPTIQACGIYNFLASDGRYVAAGLIPPLRSKSDLLEKLPKQSERKERLTKCI